MIKLNAYGVNKASLELNSFLLTENKEQDKLAL